MNLTVDTEITGRPAGGRLSRRPEAAAGDWFNTLNSTRDYTHRCVYTDLSYTQHALIALHGQCQTYRLSEQWSSEPASHGILADQVISPPDAPPLIIPPLTTATFT